MKAGKLQQLWDASSNKRASLPGTRTRATKNKSCLAVLLGPWFRPVLSIPHPETQIPMARWNHPAHQRHAAFTPACVLPTQTHFCPQRSGSKCCGVSTVQASLLQKTNEDQRRPFQTCGLVQIGQRRNLKDSVTLKYLRIVSNSLNWCTWLFRERPAANGLHCSNSMSAVFPLLRMSAVFRKCSDETLCFEVFWRVLESIAHGMYTV